jgi:hypothetical protein
LPGAGRFEVRHLGATSRFASRAGADHFAADAAKCLPRCNGHCVNALFLGEGLAAAVGSRRDHAVERRGNGAAAQPSHDRPHDGVQAEEAEQHRTAAAIPNELAATPWAALASRPGLSA